MTNRGAVEQELLAIANEATGRTLDALYRQTRMPLDVAAVARAALITGMDMAMVFAVEFPAEARGVLQVVEAGAGLTEADRAQRILMFDRLVAATRAR